MALSDLVHRYAAHVDDREFQQAVELFTDTAQFVLPEPPDVLTPVRCHDGPAGALAALSALESVTRTRHAIVGEVYTAATPDTAAGRIACVAHHWTATDEKITDVVWHLRYADNYHRTDAGWRIAHRALTIDAIETRPTRRLRG
jgi:3-phenylpropionate/cinnamic acid dioxygenase small subunit